MVDKIKFKNFKIFRNWQSLEIKPITILIGKNNSGKSAVAKLPTMVSALLKGEPLNWVYKIGLNSENSIELGSDFKDLVYNRVEAGTIELGIFSNKTYIEFAFNKEYGIIDYKLNGKEINLNSDFVGVLSNRELFGELHLNIDYLESIRADPKSVYTISNSNYDTIGLKGQNAYSVLIKDFKQEGILVKKISEWYKKNLEGWQLEVIESKTKTETKFEIGISNSSINPINIKQTGQGIHQVLPLVVRSYMQDNQPILIIVEEPETHLHPAAHATLAQRFVDSVIEDTNKRYLIETHSQNFVLRVRTLITDGTIDKKDVAIYYVNFDESKNESNLQKIEVDDNGEVDWWPEGVFNESLYEVIQLRKAQESK